MGGGAFEHLYRGRRSSSGDGSGCLVWLVIVLLVFAVILAAIGNKSNKLHDGRNSEQEELK